MNKAKKQLLILPRWYPNKTDVQLGIFVQRQAILVRDHFDVHVIYVQAVKDQKSKFETVITKENHISEAIIYFKSAGGPFRKLTNFFRYKHAQKIGYQALNSQPSFTHIHVPYRSGMLARKLNKQKNIPYFITEHWSGHLNGLYQKKNSLDQFLYRNFLKKALKISTVSTTLNQAFKKNTGFKSVLIPNYIEQSKTDRKQNSDDKIHILTVSDLDDKTKNITGLIHAFNKALSSNEKLILKIVGGGPDAEKINQLIAELNISKSNIQLLGRKQHQEVLNLMKEHDFYICNSKYETFGMTVAEALIAGMPVICTPCGGPEMYLTDSNSIRLPQTSFTSTEPLTKAILNMSKQFQSYDKEKMSQEIELKFGKSNILQQWLDFYTTN